MLPLHYEAFIWFPSTISQMSFVVEHVGSFTMLVSVINCGFVCMCVSFIFQVRLSFLKGLCHVHFCIPKSI